MSAEFLAPGSEPHGVHGLLDTFERDGVVRVPGVIGGEELRAMREGLRERMAAVEFVENAGALRPAVGTELAMWQFGREPLFAPLALAFKMALQRTFGPDVWEPVEGELGGYAMPNLPCPGTWTECTAAWHVDEWTHPGRGPERVLLGFALLDRVETGGGATVVLAGSHRRLEPLADQLAEPCTTDLALSGLAEEEPWFADLLDPSSPTPSTGCVSAGVELRLEQLTGEAGDIVLMNPRCLHTTAANVSTRARMTMRMTCLRADRPG